MKRLFIKAIRDLFHDKHRAIVSMLAIIIGMISFGVILFSYNIISREIQNVFSETNPASASILVDRVDDKLIQLTKDFKGITSFETKAAYKCRVKTSDDEWKTLELFAADDYKNMKINSVDPISGSISPEQGAALIERNAIDVANTSLGKNLTITLPDGSLQELKLTGSINDLSVHPAYMHNLVYAYVSPDTLKSFGLQNNKIDFMTAGNQYDRQSILNISNDYIDMLDKNGYKVKNLDISTTPGVSVHLEEYEGALFLLQIFSFVAFIFGCMIMSNLISSILANQIRQIGILKSIGGKSSKILAAYMLSLSSLVIISVLISLPLSILISGKLSGALMMLGNMLPMSTSIPIPLYLLFCLLGIIIPILVAFFPVRRGLKITIKEAISDYGVSASNATNKQIQSKFLSRPVLLSLRNAVRRRKRFWLNISILVFGGSLFVAVVTSMISIQSALTSNLNTLKYDYQITTNNQTNDKISNVISKVPEISTYENWGGSVGKLISSNGQTGNQYPILAPKDNSEMIKPELIEGSWLNPSDKNQVVVSHKFILAEPNYKIGDDLNIKVGDTTVSLKIKGIIKDFSSSGIYLNKTNFDKLIPNTNKQTSVKMITKSDSNRNKRKLYPKIEEEFKTQGVVVLQSESKNDMNEILQGHFIVTLRTFLIVILMIVAVSGFGLAATMNVQTSERTKEIGIMKAIGTNRKQIMRIITSESIFIALVSWLIAGLVGLVFSIAGVSVFSNNILNTPLSFKTLPFISSYAIWLVLIFIVGYLASRHAAKRAAKMSIKNALSFE